MRPTSKVGERPRGGKPGRAGPPHRGRQLWIYGSMDLWILIELDPSRYTPPSPHPSPCPMAFELHFPLQSVYFFFPHLISVPIFALLAWTTTMCVFYFSGACGLGRKNKQTQPEKQKDFIKRMPKQERQSQFSRNYEWKKSFFPTPVC